MPDSCSLEIRVIPNASRDEVVGWVGAALKVKVRAPAVEGKANDALCAFLASEWGVRASAVALVRGAKARVKVLEIRGLTLAAVQERLGA